MRLAQNPVLVLGGTFKIFNKHTRGIRMFGQYRTERDTTPESREPGTLNMAEDGSSPPPGEAEGPGYLEWAADELGVILHHKMVVKSTRGREERGVFCEEDIPAETIVVSVPWEVRALFMTHIDI